MSTITLKAKHDHLEKVASTRDPIKALAEFVWNALDADATEVFVEFPRNQLGSVDAIIIKDNGTGISKEQADHDFDSLGESWKRKARQTRHPRQRRAGATEVLLVVPKSEMDHRLRNRQLEILA